MGRRGPPPKPTVLKILAGNPGKRSLNFDEPRAPESSGHRPLWMKGQARKTWDTMHALLCEMRVMSAADEVALSMLCETYAEWRAASDVVARKKATYESTTKSGDRIIRARPEVGIAADAWRRVRAMLLEFGLTPSSRSRIQVGTNYHKDPMDEFLKRKKIARFFR